MKAGLLAFSRGGRLVLCPAMMEADLVGAAGVVSVVRTVTSEEFGPGAVAAGAVESDEVGSDEGVELLKAVSLFVSAFEAQERFSVGRAMLREADAKEWWSYGDSCSACR
jgi:hypothetical protein